MYDGPEVRYIFISRKATEFQRKEMSRMYRGKEIFKPLNTGWVDEHVACVREWVANIFFYRKGDTVIMIDAGYNYERLAEKMGGARHRPEIYQAHSHHSSGYRPCANGCKCDYTICGDKAPYLKEHPEYRDEKGCRRNK